MMLQNLMQALMGGSLPPGFGDSRQDPRAATAAAAQAGSSSGSSGGRGSSGFRVSRLPGGGFTATYSSSSGGPGSSVHVSSSTTRSGGAGAGGFPFGGMGMDDDDPMFAGPDDFLSQLLLAGARSARDNRGGRQQGGMGAAGPRPGFTHYDPSSGASDFEPFGGGSGGGMGGLEALLSQIMGPGLAGGGMGGMTYEDLAGLDPVHVTTPEEVLTSLPQSKFVEGRKPGDRWVCWSCCLLLLAALVHEQLTADPAGALTVHMCAESAGGPSCLHVFTHVYTMHCC